jgi:protein TonB
MLLLMSAAPGAARTQAHIVPNPQAPAADATQTPPSGDLTAPIWLNLPTSADFAAHTPDRARRWGKTGSAVMRCVVKYNGGLDHCVVLRETPAGLGFGAAAISMAGLFGMATQTTDGHPVAGLTITLTVEFPPL